ncbi:MAG: hypothetical protein KDK36_15425, partial [Leptospiraceae bacterium]|nr:hypothetical protein [Leptospiraceae bacterium]
IVLEKVVFQSNKEFDEAKEIFNKKNINVWVNCPRRMYDFYKGIKKYFQSKDELQLIVHGGNWGLGCNSIHFLDLWTYFTEDYDFKLELSGLDQFIIDSKREGFKEFTGTIFGYSSKNNKILLTSLNDIKIPTTIQIYGKEARISIMESKGKAWISLKENNWNQEEIEFNTPFQSQLSHLMAESILKNNNSDLISYDLSSKLHKPLIEILLKHLNNIENFTSDYCPIT